MDSQVYNSLKRLRIDDADEDRQTKRPSMQSWSSRRPAGSGGGGGGVGPLTNTVQTTHNNGAATHSHDHGAFNNVSSAAADTGGVVHHQHQRQVFTSFMVSTRTNNQYNNVNQLLHGIHMNRYGNQQRQEGWWVMEEEKEDSINDEEMVMESDSDDTGIDDIQPMEDVSFYLAANTILREAFLQRHRHPDDDPHSS